MAEHARWLSAGLIALGLALVASSSVWSKHGNDAAAPLSDPEPAQDEPEARTPVRSPSLGTMLLLAVVVLAAGALIGGLASLRLARALWLLREARRGRRTDYVIVTREELGADETTIAALPPYLPFGRADAVLVRIECAGTRWVTLPGRRARVHAVCGPRLRAVSTRVKTRAIVSEARARSTRARSRRARR